MVPNIVVFTLFVVIVAGFVLSYAGLILRRPLLLVIGAVPLVSGRGGGRPG